MPNESTRTRRHFLRDTAASLAIGSSALRAAAQPKPNVVVFFIDDMGYAETGCYGGKLAPTPNMDAMAKNGVRFTDGYVTSCVCSPSRVGLMTGRYQARTGHDANSNRPGGELDAGEITAAQYMQRAGYATAIVGKWHLGSTEPRFLPAARGFDYSVGSTSNLGEGRFYRGTQLVDTLPGAPVTTPYYTDEALRYIDRNHGNPFFLYLPYNSVHAPHVASEKWIQRFSSITDRRKRLYAAQIAEVDDAIGSVMSKLREHKLEENTLVFCISDNGGPAMADNGQLRGGKWSILEGGIRVPFLCQWKGRIRPGQVSREPVITLDVLATALAAAGGTVTPDRPLDGVNLLPLLEGKTPALHRELYWRFGPQWAVRRDAWKLSNPLAGAPPKLFHLTNDPGELKDLAQAEPARFQEMLALHDRWNAQMRPPRWQDHRWNGDWVEEKKKRKG